MDDDKTKRPGVTPMSPSLPLPPPKADSVAGSPASPEEALAAAQRIKQCGSSCIDGSHPVGRGERLDPPPQSGHITDELVRANDLSVVGVSPRLLDIEKFFPDWRKHKAEALLKVLSERYSIDPSVKNSLLLQQAVNRLTSVGAITSRVHDEIQKAIKVLHRKPSGITEDKDGKSDDIFYWAYVDANFGGASIFADLPQGWIYWRTPYVGDAMNDAISSLILSCTSNEVGGNVILFENAGFVGRYQNYGVTVPPGLDGFVEEDVSYVGDDFNDITSSILMVRRFPNETSPVSIGALIPPGDITNIVNQQSGISSAGDPTFTWDMWPTGPTSSSDWHPNDPGKRFIYVIVPITVHTPWPFPDTYAQIRYWIYLYVDGQGQLQGYTAYWGYYVSPCCFLGYCITGDIANSLSQAIPGTIGQVNGLVANALGLANLAGPYRFTYFLPGKGQFTGSTWDDVTVVGVKQ